MYTYLMLLMLFCIGIAVTLICIPMLNRMLDECGMIRQNFRGDLIPVGMGIVFIPAMVVNSVILLFSNVDSERMLSIYILLFGIMAMSFAGIIDDSIGNRNVTGIKGHFKSLFKGKLTTGGLKAMLGGLVGLLISVTISKSLSGIIVGTLVIALSTNFINLLDLRPGRAIKVYLFLIILSMPFCSNFNREIMMIILPSVIAYFYYDLKALAMMGDAGSNVLGVSLGIFVVLSFNIKVQIVWLILLILIHILTEIFSLTKIIANNKVLNYIDKLGRN